MFTRYFYLISTAAVLVVVLISVAMTPPAFPVAPAAPEVQSIMVQGCHR